MEKSIVIRDTEITFSVWDLGGKSTRRTTKKRYSDFSIISYAGQKEFVSMLPLVCNDAVAILFTFDLTRKSTLNSIKEWYRQARGLNRASSWGGGCPYPSKIADFFILCVQDAIPLLVGTKYDEFVHLSDADHEEITRQVCFEQQSLRIHHSTIFAHEPRLSFWQARKYAWAMKAPLVFCSTAESINVQKIYKIVLAKAFDLECTLPEISEIGAPIVEYKHC